MYKLNANPLFSQLKPMASIFDELLNDGLADFMGSGLIHQGPQVNILEDDAAFRIELAAPGLQKSDFKLSVEHQVLTISFEMNSEEQNTQYSRREFSRHSFNKKFQLIDQIESDQIAATYTNGVLEVTLPKRASEGNKPSRNIEIK